MSEVVVVGSFKAQPGKEDEGLEAFKALVEPTHAEDGCILYALHQGSDDPARLTFIERWASREALDAHLKTPHVAAVLVLEDEIGGCIARLEHRRTTAMQRLRVCVEGDRIVPRVPRRTRLAPPTLLA